MIPLAYPRHICNELMAAEARLNRLTMVVDAWRLTAEHGELFEIREKAINNQPLSRVEQMRNEASIMAVPVMPEWTFGELPE